MTSLEDEWLQKGTIHTNKNVDSYHSCKISDTVEYLHDKAETKHEKPVSDPKQWCHLHSTAHWGGINTFSN